MEDDRASRALIPAPPVSRRSLLWGLGGLAGVGVARSAGRHLGGAPQLLGAPQAATAAMLTAIASTASYRSRPDLRPPTIQMAVRRSGASAGVVLTDCHGGSGQQGPMIISRGGDLVWFLPVSDNGTPSLRAMNVRVQTYGGKPVLCWFEGEVVQGHGRGHYVLVDSTYRQVATVSAGNGLKGDLHEFFITGNGTAVFTTYATASADLSPWGGSTSGAYFYGEVQEVDIATGQLVFSWRSDEHVGFAESNLRPSSNGQSPYDYFHLNSVAIDPLDGNLLISSRDCWTVYKVDRQTGAIIWRLGGKRNDFTMASGTKFAFQHHVTASGGGIYTLFDNEGAPWVKPPSRGLVLQVNETSRTVGLVRQFHHSPEIDSSVLGSVQDLPDGHTFVGWGTSTYFSEYTPGGTVLFDGHLLGAGISSYRAFKQPWIGRPSGRPAIDVQRVNGGTVVYASWNGATQIAHWRVLGGSSSTSLKTLTTVGKAGFETRIPLTSNPAHVEAEALDSSGRILGRSTVW